MSALTSSGIARRWAWLESLVDATTNRPVIVPTSRGPYNSFGVVAAPDNSGEGLSLAPDVTRGRYMLGLPVYTCRRDERYGQGRYDEDRVLIGIRDLAVRLVDPMGYRSFAFEAVASSTLSIDWKRSLMPRTSTTSSAFDSCKGLTTPTLLIAMKNLRVTRGRDLASADSVGEPSPSRSGLGRRMPAQASRAWAAPVTVFVLLPRSSTTCSLPSCLPSTTRCPAHAGPRPRGGRACCAASGHWRPSLSAAATNDGVLFQRSFGVLGGSERRTVHLADQRVKPTNDGGRLRVQGYASVFNSPSVEMTSKRGRFIEYIDRNAFARVLSRNPDVLLTWDHDSRFTLARTPRTLELTTDVKGLRFFGLAARTSYAEDLRALDEDGIVTEASFLFSVAPGGETWENRGDQTVRTITDVGDLFDVCVCAEACIPRPAAS